MRILGIIGQPSSGKDTVADYLAGKGYTMISTADIIREKMRAMGLPLDRPTMQAFAAGERAKQGLHWPANLACDRVHGDTVMAGFRNTAEVEYVRSRYSDAFSLIALTVPAEIRYERARARNRQGDDISFEVFMQQEAAERSGNSQAHELDKVIAQADMVLENNGTLEELFAKVDEALEKLA